MRPVVLDDVDRRRCPSARPGTAGRSGPDRTTARAAAPGSAKVATSVALGGCAGTSRRIARVMMPRVPSAADEQLEQRQTGHVLDPLAAEGDQARRRPAPRPVRARSRWSRRTSRSTDRPRWWRCCRRSSRSRTRTGPADTTGRAAAAAALTSALKAPGSTTATRVTGSISMARIRSSDSTSPPSTAEEPPDRLVPAPRGVIGTRCSAAQRTVACTWSASVGPDHRQRHTGAGVAGPVVPVVLQRRRVGHHDTVGQGGDQATPR